MNYNSYSEQNGTFCNSCMLLNGFGYLLYTAAMR